MLRDILFMVASAPPGQEGRYADAWRHLARAETDAIRAEWLPGFFRNSMSSIWQRPGVRTPLDIPDEVFRQAKARAALTGTAFGTGHTFRCGPERLREIRRVHWLSAGNYPPAILRLT
jgi:hypothetical protein